MNNDLIKEKLQHMPNSQFIDVSGDGVHFKIMVVNTDFEGKNKIARHRLVYNYLKDWLADGSLHAVELETLTPLEWDNRK
jgi:acid stress-induced BolA-like protein IbaG/YrbA